MTGKFCGLDEDFLRHFPGTVHLEDVRYADITMIWAHDFQALIANFVYFPGSVSEKKGNFNLSS